jgi:hypothetical protein
VLYLSVIGRPKGCYMQMVWWTVFVGVSSPCLCLWSVMSAAGVVTTEVITVEKRGSQEVLLRESAACVPSVVAFCVCEWLLCFFVVYCACRMYCMDICTAFPYNSNRQMVRQQWRFATLSEYIGVVVSGS